MRKAVKASFICNSLIACRTRQNYGCSQLPFLIVKSISDEWLKLIELVI